ncbi:MAG: ATP-dependent Clp protease ATP-binding subunit ClpC [candidate division WS2 bacterium]|nr:ATP-dependent Clp protease ATP-binding subunit ClpC [Candidatus Lithacetigena glycinireducens]
MYNSKRFTERAKKVLSIAQDLSRQWGHSYVEPIHIFLSLLQDRGSVAVIALRDLNVDVDNLLRRLMPPYNIKPTFSGNYREFSRTSDLVLESARREADYLGSEAIGSEHLLLGILDQGGQLSAILEEENITYNAVKDKILSLVGDNQETIKTKSKTPMLDRFSRDLTQMAIKDKLDPVIGREKEMERIIQVLLRRTKNNPILLGMPGVGKTAIVEGLATRITKNLVPEKLRGKRLLALDLTGLIAGTKYRGEFEERLKNLIEEVQKQSEKVVLFVDEIHTLVGAGAAEGALDAASILKPFLVRGDIKCIGATTLTEYKKHMEKDPAFERRFQVIQVMEPTEAETLEILTGLASKYEEFHQVHISPEAITAATRLSSSYIKDRYLPDKAIDILDEACTRVYLRGEDIPPEIKEVEKELSGIQQLKKQSVSTQNDEEAKRLRDQEKELLDKYQEFRNSWKRKSAGSQSLVNAEDVAQVVSLWTGIPLIRLLEEEQKQLLSLEDTLRKRVVGQEEAIRIVAKAVRRARTGLKDPKRPLGVFMFLGPTGVGKTELARTLTETLFKDEGQMVRLDMSEFMERHTVSRLTGAPPGYIGYEEGGQLTEAIRRKPYSVILLDEIEKAHVEVFNILLQIFDDGRLTDGQGRVVSFSNTIIIMTSNLGTGKIFKNTAPGFKSFISQEENYEKMRDRMLEEAKNSFKPEFLNRIDDIIVFKPLSPRNMLEIVNIMLSRVETELALQGFSIVFSKELKEKLADWGYDKEYGARSLRRKIQKLIEDPLSEEILKSSFHADDTILVDLEGEEISFRKKASSYEKVKN